MVKKEIKEYNLYQICNLTASQKHDLIKELFEENKELREGIDNTILSLNETITEQRSGLINGNGVRLKLTKVVRKLIKLKKS